LQKKQNQSEVVVASCLGKNSYTLAAVKNNKQVLFTQYRLFDDKSISQMGASLAEDVEHNNLIASPCRLILVPGQYQLILMDALNVPESEMARALRWSLKGLCDYDLKDVAIDAFLVPAVSEEDKQAFVAVTPLSVLNTKRALFESAFLDVTTVTIAEMALKNLVTLMRVSTGAQDEPPIMIISLFEMIRTVYIMHQNMFYLIRELSVSQSENPDEPDEWADIPFELERSIDYCVNNLNLPHPKQLFFTPGFHRVVHLFGAIEEKLSLTVSIIDLNDYLDMDPPLDREEQHNVFYSITGALRLNDQGEKTA